MIFLIVLGINFESKNIKNIYIVFVDVCIWCNRILHLKPYAFYS